MEKNRKVKALRAKTPPRVRQWAGRAAVVFAFLLLAPLNTPSHAGAPDINFYYDFGKFYQDSLSTPSGMFIDRENEEVYIIDGERNEVLIFDSKGTPLFRFGEDRGVRNPFDVAARGDRIYITQDGKDYIEVFSYSGKPAGRISAPEGVPFSPGRIDFDDEGNIYVINRARTNCMVFDSDGKYKSTIGPSYRSLTGFALGGDKVYLITPFDSRAIQVYGRDGGFIANFEGLDGEGGSLGLPMSVTVDSKGFLWVLDAIKGVVVYGPDWKETARFTDMGPARGQLFFPIDIAFNGEDMLYILEKASKRVSVFKVDR